MRVFIFVVAISLAASSFVQCQRINSLKDENAALKAQLEDRFARVEDSTSRTKETADSVTIRLTRIEAGLANTSKSVRASDDMRARALADLPQASQNLATRDRELVELRQRVAADQEKLKGALAEVRSLATRPANVATAYPDRPAGNWAPTVDDPNRPLERPKIQLFDVMVLNKDGSTTHQTVAGTDAADARRKANVPNGSQIGFITPVK